MQGLYEGYKNLIQRIMEPKSTTIHGMTTPRSMSGLGTGVRGVVLAQSASQRFERLGDRIQLLILSGTQEFLAEKDALISMVRSPSQAPDIFADTTQIVLQHQYPKRLGGYSTPHPLSNPPRQTQRPLSTRQSHDQLLFRPD